MRIKRDWHHHFSGWNVRHSRTNSDTTTRPLIQSYQNYPHVGICCVHPGHIGVRLRVSESQSLFRFSYQLFNYFILFRFSYQLVHSVPHHIYIGFHQLVHYHIQYLNLLFLLPFRFYYVLSIKRDTF